MQSSVESKRPVEAPQFDEAQERESAEITVVPGGGGGGEKRKKEVSLMGRYFKNIGSQVWEERWRSRVTVNSIPLAKVP